MLILYVLKESFKWNNVNLTELKLNIYHSFLYRLKELTFLKPILIQRLVFLKFSFTSTTCHLKAVLILVMQLFLGCTFSD